MWERGLKLTRVVIISVTLVAPHVGAWIETRSILVRCSIFASLPMWERGLKHGPRAPKGCHRAVAPHVGAWIETRTGIAKL